MAAHPLISPLDEHNRRLIANVHPEDWINPAPAGRYNLVVIGAGSGGLISAAVAAGLGARVALIERNLLGGDCLNVGCVPSKAIIRAAHLAHDRGAVEDGDFRAAMERMRQIRAQISREDSATRYSEELSVDVYLGEGRFTGGNTIEVAGQTLEFSKAIIATGARAIILPIPGLAEAGALTNETVFELTERPHRVGVIGAGPIGCELAQPFRRLGSEVALFNDVSHILPREDFDAAEIVKQAFRREGIDLVMPGQVKEVSSGPEGKILYFEGEMRSDQITVDEIILGVGRAPNVENLGLEAAGVEFDGRNGVHVNDQLKTSNPNVYAVGDCCMQWKFTHASDAAAKIAVQNALFFGRKKLSDLIMPWVTYTDPEVAHVGMYERDAEAAGIQVDTFRVDLEHNNRAVCDGQTEGFVKIHTRKGSDKIVGATLVGANAGNMLSEITLAMVNNLGLTKIAEVIHPYPTQSEALKAAANAYMRTKLTPTAARILKGIMRLRR